MVVELEDSTEVVLVVSEVVVVVVPIDDVVVVVSVSSQSVWQVKHDGSVTRLAWLFTCVHFSWQAVQQAVSTGP
jgi:hypothetical protein